MTQLTYTGGSNIGWMHTGWPCARLTVTPETLRVAGLGDYTFTRGDVVALEPVGSVPFFHSGIRIHHNRTDCPAKIIFWPVTNRARVLAEIAGAGFAPASPPEMAIGPRGFAVRWQAVALLVAAWNVLLLLDCGVFTGAPSKPGPLMALALLMVFGLATGVKFSARLQGLLMRPGRSLGEIRPVINLLQLVTGLMLVVMAVLALVAGG